MKIQQCQECGLIFNATLEEEIIPYDDRYENRQSYSPTFTSLMKGIAEQLVARYALNGALIMEIGCGKGEFLKLICRHADAKGIGYDSSCEELSTPHENQVRFFKRYATSADVTGRVDAVVCRHVVEHVSQIGAFMQLLADIASKGDSRVVYIETPAWEWIVEHETFCDVFYEHCNYFPLPTLRYLAMRAGMEVLDHQQIFGGQYQALELKSVQSVSNPPLPRIAQGTSLAVFAERVTVARQKLHERLVTAGASRGWAIWGAGAKGVSLASAFPQLPPQIVVDSNPSKQGTFIPGTCIPVVSPDDSRLANIPVFLAANPNYKDEIRESLRQRNLIGRVVTP